MFTPLALAVVFAMLASYFLSRTLVPTMEQYLLGVEAEAEARKDDVATSKPQPTWRSALRHPSYIPEAFNLGFDRLRLPYHDLLHLPLSHTLVAPCPFFLFAS